MNDNPYQSPGEMPPHPTRTSLDRGRPNPLLPPAICLLSLSGLYLAILLLLTPIRIMELNAIDTSTPDGFAEYIGYLIGMLLVPVMSVAIIIGCISMIRLKGYSGAVTAAVVAMIPLCSPCLVLGIPFGIWALVLLLNSEVKNRFT